MMIFSRRFDAEASSQKRMRSSSRMPPSFLLLLELAPKPDAKIMQTFSLSRSSLGSKAKAVREERDDFSAVSKFESNGFFFSVSLRLSEGAAN